MAFWKELLSNKGTISSKRFMGVVVLSVSMVCITYLTIVEGGTTIVNDLIQTSLIIAASLLGISNVTSIWKGRNIPPMEEPEDKNKKK